MNNCLVTKLKGSVNNDNLPMYDTLKVALSAGTEIKVHFDVSDLVKVLTKDGLFEFTFEPNNTSYPLYTPATDTILFIKNKRALNTLTTIGGGGLVQGISNFMEYLSSIKYCTNLTSVAAAFTGGDLSDIASILPQLTNLILTKSLVEGSEYITGDIALLSNNPYITSLQGVMDGTDITGDLSTAGQSVNHVYLSQGRGRKGTWKGTRDSSYPIISFLSPMLAGSYVDFGDDLDNMLINQAACSLTGTHSNKKIVVTGNRTTASDTAVSTLKEKGYQIWVNGVTL